MKRAAGQDRAAHFGDKGWEVGGDEGELIATAKETKENERVGRVFERAFEDLAEALFQLCLAGHLRRAHEGEQHEHRKNGRGEDDEHALPRHQVQQEFSGRCANDLASTSCGCSDGQRHGAVRIRTCAANHRKNDAETRACNAEPHENFEHLMRLGCDREGRQNKASGIDERACDDGFAITDLFCQRPEYGLTDPPRKVLDRDGEREFGP